MALKRIKRGVLALDEVLPLFLQIAEGLEAAHEKPEHEKDIWR